MIIFTYVWWVIWKGIAKYIPSFVKKNLINFSKYIYTIQALVTCARVAREQGTSIEILILMEPNLGMVTWVLGKSISTGPMSIKVGTKNLVLVYGFLAPRPVST